MKKKKNAVDNIITYDKIAYVRNPAASARQKSDKNYRRRRRRRRDAVRGEVTFLKHSTNTRTEQFVETGNNT